MEEKILNCFRTSRIASLETGRSTGLGVRRQPLTCCMTLGKSLPPLGLCLLICKMMVYTSFLCLTHSICVFGEMYSLSFAIAIIFIIISSIITTQRLNFLSLHSLASITVLEMSQPTVPALIWSFCAVELP